MKDNLYVLKNTNLLIDVDTGKSYSVKETTNITFKGNMELTTTTREYIEEPNPIVRIYDMYMEISNDVRVYLAINGLDICYESIRYLQGLKIVRPDTKLMKSFAYFDKPVKHKHGWYVIPSNVNYVYNTSEDIIADIKHMFQRHIAIPKVSHYYPNIRLSGISYQWHRLKLLALGEADEDMEHNFIVDHKDTNRHNLKLDNLRWTSPSANSRIHNTKGNPCNKFKMLVKDLNTGVITTFHSFNSMCREIGFSVMDVSKIYNPLKHGPYKGKVWKEEDDTRDFHEVLMEKVRFIYKVKMGSEVRSYPGANSLIWRFMRDFEYDSKEVHTSTIREFKKRHSDKELEVVNNFMKKVDVLPKAWNPITDEVITAESFRKLGTKLGFKSTGGVVVMYEKGPNYVHSCGYVIMDGNKENERLINDYARGLDSYSYNGKTVRSLRAFENITGISRGTLTKLENGVHTVDGKEIKIINYSLLLDSSKYCKFIQTAR